MQKYRTWLIATVFLLLAILLMLPPRVAAFHYVHHWKVNFSGSLVVSGNQSLPISPFWDYIGNTTWQTSEQLSFTMYHNNYTISASEISTDADGNPQLRLNLTSTLEPDDVLQWYEEWLFTVSDRRPSLPVISIEQSGSLDEIQNQLGTDDYLWYTRGTQLWKTENTSLINRAQQIRNELPDELQNNVLALIFEAIRWIQTNIYRSTGITEPQYPEETLISQIGDCDDQSNLLIAFLRIYNIPSYLMTGHWFQEGTRTSGFVWGSIADNAYLYVDWQNSIGHGWTMIYVPPWGWLPFDLISVSEGADPTATYTDSLYASGLPFVTLWQIVTSDYIAERRAEEANLFTLSLHRTDYEEWTSLGSIPIVDTPYLATNMATLIALTITLGLLSCLVGLAIRRQPQEEPE